jgi:hypothetical protein
MSLAGLSGATKPALVLLAGGLLAGVIALGAGSDGGERFHPQQLAQETATTVPAEETETPTVTGTAIAATIAGPSAAYFEEFVRQVVVPAVAEGDLSAFASRAETSRIVCRAEHIPGPNLRYLHGPKCTRIGDEFEGFGLGRWRSEGSIVPLERALEPVRDILTRSLPEKADEYGSGAPQVYALGTSVALRFDDDLLVPRPEVGLSTIITAIISGRADVVEARRVVVVLTWVGQDGDYLLNYVLDAPVLAEELLEPNHPEQDFVSNWRRFQP